MAKGRGVKAATKVENVCFRVADSIGLEIVSGSYAQNSALPTEAELGAKYNASRTALREAMKMLVGKGLVSVRPKQGSRIRPEREWNLLDSKVLQWLVNRRFSQDLLVELMELRISMEPGAAALAARNATAADRTAISRAADALFAAERENSGSLEADIAFHLAIVNASHNRFFIQLCGVVEAALRFSIRRAHTLDAPMTTALDHKRISDPVIAGDSLAASDAMRAHLQDALFFMRQHAAVDPSPEWETIAREDSTS